MNIHYYSNQFLWQLYHNKEYQEIQTTTLTTTKNDTTTWQLHNAMIYTGSYSASNINIMLKYETWPNLKAVYRLIIIMNIQWYHGKIWFLKSKYWKYWHSHSVFTVVTLHSLKIIFFLHLFETWLSCKQDFIFWYKLIFKWNRYW